MFDFFVVTYFKNELFIHRSKLENSQQLWETQLNQILTPSLNQHVSEMKQLQFDMSPQKKTDIVIHGLGWICISGNVKKINVLVHEKIGVSLREGMI